MKLWIEAIIQAWAVVSLILAIALVPNELDKIMALVTCFAWPFDLLSYLIDAL